VAYPDPSCRAPTVAGAARLTLKTTPPSQFEVTQTSLRWRWARGQDTALEAFGDPVHTDAYTLCLYDSEGTSTLLRAIIPPGTSWRTRPKGFRYSDRLGVANGVTTVDLKAGGDGQARVMVRAAKGPHLTLPGLPLFPPVTMQLRGHGECWGATYDQAGVRKNTPTTFVGKSAP
jgi:hypothetical protein